MSRGQRYEPIPQNTPSEPIILSPIPINTPSYNYNSGIPTSISSAAPSIASIPNSPPPSFHTHSSPGTPRPSHTQQALHNAVFGNGANRRAAEGGAQELWGVAPSTIGGETLDGLGTSSEVLGTLKGLRQRVEWLEESMGRLLLEKEESKSANNKHPRDNCCVTFTDASPDLEMALVNSRGNNCCVAFSGSSKTEAKRKEQKMFLAATLFVVLVVCMTIAVVMTAKSGRVNRAVNRAVDGVVKSMQ